jgi:hypothetical protein
MNAQTDTTGTLTADDRVKYVTRSAIWNITATAMELHRKLVDARRDADKAIEQMEAGMQVYGGSYGPLGLQGPADIARLSAKLRDDITLALQLGVSEEAVVAAHAEGVSGN